MNPVVLSSGSASAVPAAFLIGGVSSGCGKTTLTLGILAALKARGLAVQPFKCGPDFIDPSLHRMVTGQVSPNLDLKMCGAAFCRDTFRQRLSGQNIGVVEGVMGLFDGGDSSSAALARTLNIPVILVVDARSAAESVAAVIKGFEVYDSQVQVRGVIVNRVSGERHAGMIREAVAGSCRVKILGFFPRDVRFEIPDRHLGLHMGEESPLDAAQLAGLVAAMEEHIDLDLLLELGAGINGGADVTTQSLSVATESRVMTPSRPPLLKLAVARDLPFCFYYEDNLTILARAGFELVPFSPLHDDGLPQGVDALYLGGGYPELHAPALSANTAMRTAIAAWAAAGGVIYAECGGFMYLCEELIDLDGTAHTMAGVFPATVRMQNRLARLGYRRPRLLRDCLWGKKDGILHGHEFHYSVIDRMAPEVETLYRLEDGRTEGYSVGNTVGGYMHLHFARSEKNVAMLYDFVMHHRILSR